MRKLATAAAVSLALSSGGAFGLGLGDIEMQSALNQPMDAEIPLTSVRPGELDGMIVQLASEEAFARAGIERSQVLADLRFSVDQSSGVPVIRIESASPVVEPFLNFLLEVDWPQGRMVREYTVLLDPPVFMTPSASERNTAADQPALVDSGEAAQVVPTPIQRDVELEDQGLVIDLGELEDATSEDVLSLDEATAENPISDEGELVSLEGLSDESLLGGTADADNLAGDDGNVVALTDLGAPNIVADAERATAAVEAFSFDDIQVESLGSSEEVPDNLVVGDDGQPLSLDIFDEPDVSEDGSTIVSLDDLDIPEQTVAIADQTGQTGSSGDEIVVGNGDTLFEIARDNTPGGISVQQMMMAMLAANESAFINNNINLLRAGTILRIPDQTDAERLSQTEAIAAISDQNSLWQDYRDSLRATAGTQIAQTIADDSTAPTTNETDESGAAGQTIESVALETDSAIDGLSDEARAILDNARNEILNGEELNIVADNAPSNTTASATADETSDSDAELIGEVNRQLQLAREELASSRLRSSDLSDRASELQNTTESLDAMVSLRQDEVARLEEQLVVAREAAEEEARLEEERVAQEAADAAQAAEDAAQVAEDAAQAAEDAAAEAAAEAEASIADAADNLITDAEGVADNAVDTVEEAAADAESAVTDAADELVADAESALDTAEQAGSNALTEAGKTLDEVELLTPDDPDSTVELDMTDVAETTEEAKSWYQEFLDDPKRMAIAGIGGLGLLGVLGTLMFRRKRNDPDDELLDMGESVEFDVDAPAAPDMQAAGSSGRLDDTAAFVAAGAASAAGAGAIALGGVDDENDEKIHDTFSKGIETDNTLTFGAKDDANTLPAADGEEGASSLDKDDTISEVDVYLAYGLHGQAEELLTKAIERKPDNTEYAGKLLQTYHAQGNVEAFHATASDYHQRFGSEDNPAWASIAQMGSELRPGDPLYFMESGLISQVPEGDAGSATMGASDFESISNTESSGSVNRGFDSAAAESADDESELMDSSIDPAFAFDEGDLEATGDFSAIVDELASDDDGAGIDLPGLNDTANLSKGIGSTLADNELSMTELDGLSDSVDDLTLDLDQLSGDLELDSAELLNSDLSDLEIPDINSDSELLLDSSGALGGDDADEMDTMMDLAKAYIDMGDKDSASSALGEIVKSGSPEQVTEAETLLSKIS
ncbi:MAG: FimV/HubP family polar landmark protein [Granulosicoccus sp.]